MGEANQNNTFIKRLNSNWREMWGLHGYIMLQLIQSLCKFRVRSLYECFHTRSKCAIRMIIQVTVILITVFWPVCTQISITKDHEFELC